MKHKHSAYRGGDVLNNTRAAFTWGTGTLTYKLLDTNKRSERADVPANCGDNVQAYCGRDWL